MNLWKEFLWGGLAGAIGETVMHPVDTLKTRIQSGGPGGLTFQRPNDIRNVFKSIWITDGLRGFYRGVVPGLTGSFVTGATYFGFIEGTKDWLQETNPHLAGPWAHFLAGATGDTLGSIVFVPCEVMKQRMQVQGSRKAWQAALAGGSGMAGGPGYQYYSSIWHAGRSIIKQEGWHGLYTGYFSTLARDVPFAGFQIMFYEAFREAVEYFHSGRSHGASGLKNNSHEFSSMEELVLGGAAGGISAFLTTPMDVIKTRLQVQGTSARYKGWLDALQTIWREESVAGFFKGAGPRVLWFVPAAGLTFMSVEFLRKNFNEKPCQFDADQHPQPHSTLPGRHGHPVDITAVTAPNTSYEEQIRGVVVNPVQTIKVLEP